MDTNVSLKETANDAFEQYAGAVLQSRALVDVRDCVKPSTRQILYAMSLDGLTYDKPFKKTLKAIASAMRYYIHGDASVEGIVMHCAQPFFMRYPLVEVEGSYGTQIDTESWAAPRYTSSRLSKVTDILLGDTNKHTIEEWEDNYDNTDEYPRILSSLGFYNIVNGSFGIGLGMASSIPQFNLKEVNNALITLLENPDCSFEDILCYPDFCTGGTIINKDEIVDSLKNGQGKACIIRATIDYDKSDNCLIVKDLPYGVYSNTICTEIEKLVAEDENCGITNVNDLTGENVNIKIYLKRRNIQDKVLALLYDKTSLQKSISINMTMLEDGRFPKVFGWREALSAHLAHEKKTYVNYYNYELEKLSNRLDIVNGFLYVIENTEKVINIIKTGDDVRTELAGMCKLKDNQIKAILDMRLARLSHLDNEKYQDEKKSLESQITDVKRILGSEDALKQVMIDRFREVADEFGDARRTKVVQMNVEKVTKKKSKQIYDVYIKPEYMTGTNKVVRIKKSTSPNDGFKCKSNDLINIVDTSGNLFRISAEDIKDDTGRGMVTSNLPFGGNHVSLVLPNRPDDRKPYIVFGFLNGKVLKMSKENLVGTTRNLRGHKLVKGDVIGVIESNGDIIHLETSEGRFLDFDATTLRASKSGSGRQGIKLEDGDEMTGISITHMKAYVQGLGGKGNVLEHLK